MNDQFAPKPFAEQIAYDLEHGFPGEVRPDPNHVFELRDRLEKLDPNGERALAGVRRILAEAEKEGRLHTDLFDEGFLPSAGKPLEKNEEGINE